MDESIIALVICFLTFLLLMSVGLNALVGHWAILIVLLAILALEVRSILRKRHLSRIREKIKMAKRRGEYNRLMEKAHRYIEEERVEEALELCNKALEFTDRKSKVAEKYEEAGDTFMDLGEFEKAAHCFQEAEELLKTDGR